MVIVNAISVMREPIPGTFTFIYIFGTSNIREVGRFEGGNLNLSNLPLTFQAPSIWYAAVATPRRKFGGNCRFCPVDSPLAELEKTSLKKLTDLSNIQHSKNSSNSPWFQSIWLLTLESLIERMQMVFNY